MPVRFYVNKHFFMFVNNKCVNNGTDKRKNVVQLHQNENTHCLNEIKLQAGRRLMLYELIK